VIGQLALWFAIHLLFRSGQTMEVAGLVRVMLPDLASLDYAALGLTVLALALTFATRLPMLAMIGVLIVAGALLKAFGLS
jgi:chromate transporter